MNFNGFTEEDFNVFSIEGLEERMAALTSVIRPKLEYLGSVFVDKLSAETGQEMFYHTAKHARRTKNPPNDTWVAFSSNKRGYKMLPHFQIGLWETHVFIWFAVIYEAPSKSEIGRNFERHFHDIMKSIPDHFVWSGDHMKPDAKPAADLGKEGLLQMFQRLQNVKKAELLCGLHIPREKAATMGKEELLQTIDNAFDILVPLYRMA